MHNINPKVDIFDEVLFPTHLRMLEAEIPLRKSPTKQFKSSANFESTDSIALEGKSLFMFTSDNLLRKRLAQIVTKRWYKLTISSIGVASSLILVVSSPLRDPETGINFAVKIIEYVV